MAKTKGKAKLNKSKAKKNTKPDVLGISKHLGRLTEVLSREQRVRLKYEQRDRNSAKAEAGILDQKRFRALQKGTDFFDLLGTTLGNDVRDDGLLRQLEPDDLRKLAKRAQQLKGKYRGGIKPTQVINAALPIDRRRCSEEIRWSHPTMSRYRPSTKSLIITFTTAASGKYQEKRHFVDVELLEFDNVTGHFLEPENLKEQARLDAKELHNTPIKFNCDCGRHTYWYRFIASTGDFAYIGRAPLGRAEQGFPKIRNPRLKGIACKHVLRTMKAMLSEKSYNDFLMKACIKQYKVGDSTKATKVNTTRRDMEASVKRQEKANSKDGDVLSEKEKRINKRLLSRYKQALSSGMLSQRSPKNRKSNKEKLGILAKAHNVDKYTNLIK